MSRTYLPKATTSKTVVLFDNEPLFRCVTLELPWQFNKRSISCIPEGVYTVVKEGPTEKRPYVYFRVLGVPGRSGILWHPGNYTRQIKGCQLHGATLKYLDGDDIIDVTDTVKTLEKLANILPDTFTLTIKKAA